MREILRWILLYACLFAVVIFAIRAYRLGAKGLYTRACLDLIVACFGLLIVIVVNTF